MNIVKMMKQAKEMQEQMKGLQQEMSEKIYESSVGGDKIKVTSNGAGEVLSIKIDPSIVDPNDVEMLEDLLLSGIKSSLANGKKEMSEKMGEMTGGLNIPGLSDLGL